MTENKQNSWLRRVPLVGPGLAKRFQRAPTVAVLRLSGVIGQLGGLRRGGLTLDELAGPIEKAFELPRLKAVALAINSSGGSPVQSALIAGRIRDLAEEKSVPVYAFCEDVAASGGYWLACAADEIYANGASIVGS
ncbi:MAG TPA: S49 family peptidase, partial [Thermohalobaculum sp.]|nr:S49 family peptidase [Thermohalobaculum sp.]